MLVSLANVVLVFGQSWSPACPCAAWTAALSPEKDKAFTGVHLPFKSYSLGPMFAPLEDAYGKNESKKMKNY